MITGLNENISYQLRCFEEGFAGAFSELCAVALVAVVTSLTSEGMHLGLEAEDPELRLFEVVVKPLDLAVHAVLYLEENIYLKIGRKLTKKLSFI